MIFSSYSMVVFCYPQVQFVLIATLNRNPKSIDRFIETGDYNLFEPGFPGRNALEIAKSVARVLWEELSLANVDLQ